MITFTKTKMIVTLANGDKAARSTKNIYGAAIVGYKKGKLVICSAHTNKQLAVAALDKVNRGIYVNFKFKGVTDLQIVAKQEEKTELQKMFDEIDSVEWIPEEDQSIEQDFLKYPKLAAMREAREEAAKCK